MLLRDEEKAGWLSKFFQIKPGGYGEGDRMLGINNPQVRAVVKEFRKVADVEDVRRLAASPWHEIRVTGLLLLVELYHTARVKDRKSRRRKASDIPDSDADYSRESARALVDEYLGLIPCGNNWDLVDLVAPKILGDWLTDHPEELCLLDELSEINDLWHQRVAIVSTWTLIRAGVYEPTLRLAERYLTHSHDLIHKASGWMLREVGKHGGEPELLGFLDRHAARMPRTMLRYALEKLPTHRARYMQMR